MSRNLEAVCAPVNAGSRLIIDLGAAKSVGLIGEVRNALEAALREFDQHIPQIAAERWLWPGKVRFGANRFTIFTGDEESDLCGLAARMASVVSRGLAWPGTDERCAIGRVLVCARTFAIENELSVHIQDGRSRLDIRARAMATLYSSTRLIMVLWRRDYAVGCTFPDLLDVFENLAALASPDVAVVLVDLDGTLSEPGMIAEAVSCTRGRDIVEVSGGWEIQRKIRASRHEIEQARA